MNIEQLKVFHFVDLPTFTIVCLYTFRSTGAAIVYFPTSYISSKNLLKIQSVPVDNDITTS